ncbi:Crp/Fnr family transcriptional regulator [Pararhizobium sp.]|uniref:Crp/Fnr family transcriptional regulator n=1 Tax=Pararhizobium sp. TaxID=1977563 RepID=UPI0027245CBC|nr:Crp/Fnr family transcriptional regulator [Pararhizobium sp.]MDO9416942.1 Crp/Fnr family transcriptional regulator [Pararhizobium sp.]
MPHVAQHQISNRLLSVLSAPDYALLAPYLEPVELPRLFSLSQAHTPSDHSYFPTSGIGSIVAASQDGQSAEVGVFGREGMTPTAVVLNTASDPFSIFMQVSGEGYRIRNDVFRDALRQSSVMKALLDRYAQVCAVQTAYTALSNAVHHIDERLARWILMCHDRTEGDEILLTHEFLAVMLAVRRPTVTTALHVLEGNRFIYSERGMIVIRNREALEAFAKDAYGVPEQEYHRLIGPIKPALN